jgi:hypothetical protein
MNEQTIIDAIPTAKLMRELGAKRTSFYAVLTRLNITPFMDGKTSMIRPEKAQIVKDHYQQKNIVELNGNPVQTITYSELDKQTNSRTNIRTDKQAELLIPALEIISRLVPAAPPADPLVSHRRLQEACDRNWRLSTHQLAQLLGRSAKSIQRYQSFTQLGFQFESYEKGKYRTWSIYKAEL